MPALNTFRAAEQLFSKYTIRRASVFYALSSATAVLLARGTGGRICSSAIFAADLIAQHGAFDLRLFQHIDDQYAIGQTGQAVFDRKGTTQRSKGRWRPASGGAFPAESAGATAH